MKTLERELTSVHQSDAAKTAHALTKAASVNLDMIRGIAAILVMVSHWRYIFFQDAEAGHVPAIAKPFYFITGFGHQSVVVFFVLSGYLVGGSVLRSMKKSNFGWPRYLVDRGTRLYMVMIPALVATACLDLIGISKGAAIYSGSPTWRLMFADPIASHLSWATGLGNVAFLQNILVPTLGSNGPMWSLANEFWYYMAFPFLLYAIYPGSTPAKRILGALATVAILAFVHTGIAIMFSVWLMGAAIAAVPAPRILHSRTAVVALFLVWALSMGVSRVKLIHPEEIASIVVGVFTALWLWAVIGSPRQEQPEAYVKTAKSLSAVSYSMYLFHVPFLVLVAALIGLDERWSFGGSALAKSGAILLATCIYVVAMWRCFEFYTPALKKRLLQALKI
jgi:peptidoglycan/LPS O-acetylase OafA/YrhL